MRQFIFRGVAAILVAGACCWGSAWGASPTDSPGKARYPVLAHVTAGLIILIVVPIVAFPSRKEIWDQGVEKRKRTRKEGKRRHDA